MQAIKFGKFISPHLITFNDGICINNEQIKDEEVDKILVPMVKIIDEYNKNHKIPVKWFEVITSLVFIYFYQQKCDIAVIETGLGGTLDCTNVIEKPIVSILTKIGYDHMDILGDKIEDIASQKTGIIKKNSQTIFVKQDDVVRVIEEKCKQENNTLHLIDKNLITNYSYTNSIQKFDYKDYKQIEINLLGKIQTQNAAECLEAIDILKNQGFIISEDAIRKGLKTVVHRARMEKIGSNPTIIFDGGHNESAIQNLKNNIEQYYKSDKKMYIISLLTTKDYKTIIKELCTDKQGIFYFTDGIKDKPYVKAKDLYIEAIKYISKDQVKCLKLEDAIKEAKDSFSDRTIFIIGSFYVYKKVMEIIG